MAGRYSRNSKDNGDDGYQDYDDYEEYARKNQFGGIVYIQKSDSVLAIDLSTGEVQPVEL